VTRFESTDEALAKEYEEKVNNLIEAAKQAISVKCVASSA
jgi:hypothetical protein